MWILNNLWNAQEARRVLTGIVRTNSLLKQKRILIHLMIQIHFACFLYWVEKATPFIGLVLFCFLCNVFLRIFFFFFFELEKTLGTRMEHSAVMLTHHSISSTLNQVSPHGTVWTNQLIQSQFTTPNLDSHLCAFCAFLTAFWAFYRGIFFLLLHWIFFPNWKLCHFNPVQPRLQWWERGSYQCLLSVPGTIMLEALTKSRKDVFVENMLPTFELRMLKNMIASSKLDRLLPKQKHCQ